MLIHFKNISRAAAIVSSSDTLVFPGSIVSIFAFARPRSSAVLWSSLTVLRLAMFLERSTHI